MQLAGDERLGLLGVLGRLLHLTEQPAELFALLAETVGDLLALAGVAELAMFGLVELLELIRQLLLSLIELARFVAHAVHVFRELAGGAFAEVVAELVEILGGARAGGDGVGDHALL
jgi:hypothetical protein